jgi:hypothetical protein
MPTRHRPDGAEGAGLRVSDGQRELAGGCTALATLKAGAEAALSATAAGEVFGAR